MQIHTLLDKMVADAAPPYAILAITVPLVEIDALARVLRDVPSSFRLPIVVALLGQPRPGETIAELPSRLQPHTSLGVRWIGHRVPLRAGSVSLCVPGESMIVGSDLVVQRVPGTGMSSIRSAKTLLDSIAASHGERALALVLGRAGAENASGIRSMKQCGATLVVQDEAAAQAWGSARKAIDAGHVDAVLPLERIASTLARITAARRRPGATGPHRSIGMQLFDRRRAVPYEVEAVHRAMRRVLGALEELCPVDAAPPSAVETKPADELGNAIATELGAVTAAAGRTLLVDCAPSIASVVFDPDVVLELTRRLLENVLASSAGKIEIRISPLRLFLQIAVTGEQQSVPGAAYARDDLQALHAIVKPLRGHVMAGRREGRVEYAIWLPRTHPAVARGRATAC